MNDEVKNDLEPPSPGGQRVVFAARGVSGAVSGAGEIRYGGISKWRGDRKPSSATWLTGGFFVANRLKRGVHVSGPPNIRGTTLKHKLALVTSLAFSLSCGGEAGNDRSS